MTGPARLLYDTYYHIYNRGTNRENIFVQERNYYHFLKLYTKYIAPITETYAYCLLKNHFHLLVRIKSVQEIFAENQPTGDRLEQYPSRKFSDFFYAYSKAINAAYGRTGSLFQHPFGRVLVTGERQFWNTLVYIHHNPQKHKFVQDFRDWKWSSYGLIQPKKHAVQSHGPALGWYGGAQPYQELHSHWMSAAESAWLGEDADE